MPGGGDKLVHFAAYGLMALLRYPVSRRRGASPVPAAWWGFLLVCAIGAAVEGVQAALPYRLGSFADLLANGVGAALGTAALLLSAQRRQRTRPGHQATARRRLP